MHWLEPRAKCLKCQRMILTKDVPKRCSASWSKRQESHVIELGWPIDEVPWIRPYGMSDADWKEWEVG